MGDRGVSSSGCAHGVSSVPLKRAGPSYGEEGKRMTTFTFDSCKGPACHRLPWWVCPLKRGGGRTIMFHPFELPAHSPG